MTAPLSADNSAFSPTNYVPEIIDTLDAQKLVNNVIAILFLMCLIFALHIKIVYPPKDYFVNRALYFLIVSLVIRLIMATMRFFFEEKIDSGTQSIPWQQIYFEVPFYFFLIVPMSLLFSWKLAYQNISDFVEGRNDSAENFSVNRERFESAESLDHVISASVINDTLRISEPLL
jgi:hypothetical protein